MTKDIKATLTDGKVIDFKDNTSFIDVIKRLLTDIKPGDDISGVSLEYKEKVIKD